MTMRCRSLLWVCMLSACAPEIPEGTYVCAANADCPPAMFCQGGLCYRDVDAGPCTAQTCESLRANCGAIDDGCGGELECGECPDGEACGAGGIANICDCVPRGCDDACGAVQDGCGRTLDCGGCPGGRPCVEGTCVCTPTTCDAEGAVCGQIADGCGGTLECGSCPAELTCGALGMPNRCGMGACTPRTCGGPGLECGAVSDGCDGTLDCGPCGSNAECVLGTCECLPRTCDDLGTDACGGAPDGCGGTLDCGTCGPGYGCMSNTCGCLPDRVGDAYSTASELGPISTGFTRSYHTYAITPSGDVDWFKWSFSGTAGPRTDFIVGLDRLTANLELSVFVLCDSGSDIAPPECASGSTAVTDPTAGSGCASRNFGTAREDVAVSVDCMPTAFYVRVAQQPPMSALLSCDAYELTVEMNTR